MRIISEKLDTLLHAPLRNANTRTPICECARQTRRSGGRVMSKKKTLEKEEQKQSTSKAAAAEADAGARTGATNSSG